MSDRNFDGGVKFVIKTRGSAITSPTFTLIYSIYHKNKFLFTSSFTSSLISYSTFYFIISFTSSNNYFSTSSIISNPFNFSFIYFISFIFNNSIIFILYTSIIISTTLTGIFNITITPRGIIITNLSFISIFIITIVPILTIIMIILHTP